MTNLNTKSSRWLVLYGSAAVVIAASMIVAAVYLHGGPNTKTIAVVGDPTKKIGTGDQPSKNAATIPGLDKPAEAAK